MMVGLVVASCRRGASPCEPLAGTNMLVGGARLDPNNHHDYSEIEARVAYERMVREHGWY